MAVRDVESAALRLPPRARARLASRLLASLEESREEGCEALWVAEAERRHAAYKEGKMRARPTPEVLRDARRRL